MAADTAVMLEIPNRRGSNVNTTLPDVVAATNWAANCQATSQVSITSHKNNIMVKILNS